MCIKATKIGGVALVSSTRFIQRPSSFKPDIFYVAVTASNILEVFLACGKWPTNRLAETVLRSLLTEHTNCVVWIDPVGSGLFYVNDPDELMEIYGKADKRTNATKTWKTFYTNMTTGSDW